MLRGIVFIFGVKVQEKAWTFRCLFLTGCRKTMSGQNLFIVFISFRLPFAPCLAPLSLHLQSSLNSCQSCYRRNKERNKRDLLSFTEERPFQTHLGLELLSAFPQNSMFPPLLRWVFSESWGACSFRWGSTKATTQSMNWKPEIPDCTEDLWNLMCTLVPPLHIVYSEDNGMFFTSGVHWVDKHRKGHEAYK